ncbi:ubiquitin-activating enzyme E1 [Chondrus crispus]|uniref:NEDD8-activating enzyme E1 catalytic subunit n=1 Tax=Chondrus crispus TaxID=2769 RepID=R7Q1I8_CHOCR|nr:ubiquitin-activating enzyme E1 [Chondrus crispus]CDF32457.1 ubiquitin-activating enzyme E1 [Chondrus crispus]|eukprot:XP_005712122.1 ubiquitin-activating enzyme E1 [Chondrus crispus]
MQSTSSPGQPPPDVPGWSPGGSLWGGLGHLLRHSSPLSQQLSPEAAADTESFLRTQCKLLIIGAGGLGCELLKNAALSGFRDIHVIDLDTIDLTNLNRQFLFRTKDVGEPKATVAADFVNNRIPGANVTPYHANIMDFDKDFYRQFHLVIAGLDSIDARRWLNAMLYSLVERDDEGNPVQETIIPLIDGGTEGFQGQARIIIPSLSSCFECTLSLFPPAKNFPLCTIANTPRLPEHCIEYANAVLWDKMKPFGNSKLDTDKPEHTNWLFEQAKERADHFGIKGVTYRLTQGVAKNIIPAVASSNAIVAAACANEAVKMITSIANNMDNYMMYNGRYGVYTYTYRNEKRPDCPVCGAPALVKVTAKGESTLAEFLETIAGHPELRSRKPFLRTSTGKTLYAAAPAHLRKATEGNLDKKLEDLISSNMELTLSDKDLPFIRTVYVSFI